MRSPLLIAGALVALLLSISVMTGIHAQTRAALSGHVSSSEEGSMEGVLVSAEREGSNITVTVVSDAQGHYSFPVSRLAPGAYGVSIRAAGYVLEGPSSVQIGAGGNATANLHLRKTTNLAAQLTDAEWLASMPGTDAQKRDLLDCDSCHAISRITTSHFTANQFQCCIVPLMATFAPGSTPLQPETRMNMPRARDAQQLRAFAEYLASINLSGGSWTYPLKTYPRLKGRSTHVIITEYDLPRRVTEPHDVILDGQGMAWYTDFGTQVLGELDPRTGKVTEYHVPTLKPGYANGELDLERDPSGSLWLGMMLQGGVANFDPRTKQFKTYPMPPDINDNAAQIAMVTPPQNGVLWTNDVDKQTVHRLNLQTGQWETFGPLHAGNHQMSVYGLYADSHNNAYTMDFTADGNNIGRVDAQTGQTSAVSTPTKNVRTRRGRFDGQDHLYFAEYAGNAVGMLDVGTGKVTEWPLPTPWDAPYDVVADKHGEVWAGSMWTDRISRLDTKTGNVVEYMLPRSTNIRRVFVDNTKTPVQFWTGSNHGASIVKLEPTD